MLPRVEVCREVDETHLRSSIPQYRRWSPETSCTAQSDLHQERGRIVRFVSRGVRPSIGPKTELVKPL